MVSLRVLDDRPARRRTTTLFAALGLAVCAWAALPAAPSGARTACGLKGSWTQTTDQVGTTTWVITAGGKATEGSTAEGKATLSGKELTITWKSTRSKYEGVYHWTLNENCAGSGTLHFTQKDQGDTRQDLHSVVTGPAPHEVPDLAVARSGSWGKPAPSVDIAPGDATLIHSPKIGRRQRTAKVTLGLPSCSRQAGSCSEGTDPFVMMLAPLSKKHRLLTCMVVFNALRRQFVINSYLKINEQTGQLGSFAEYVEEGDDAQAVFAAAACMETYRDLEAKEAAQSARATATAAGGCGVGSLPMTFRANVRRGTATTKANGRGKRGQSGPLRTSCSYGPNGITLRVKPRSRKATLRSIVGSHLVVGVHRASDSKGPGRVQATFARP
jgi:hypothetical protein